MGHLYSSSKLPAGWIRLHRGALYDLGGRRSMALARGEVHGKVVLERWAGLVHVSKSYNLQ